MRFLADGSAWAYIAAEQAISDAELDESDVSNERTGLIVGTGGPSTRAIVKAADQTRDRGAKHVGPFVVPKAMCSMASDGQKATSCSSGNIQFDLIILTCFYIIVIETFL